MFMSLSDGISKLKKTLVEIEKNDPSKPGFFPYHKYMSNQEYYEVRNDAIYEAVTIARLLEYPAGFLVHQPVQELIDKSWDHRWGVVAFIELPTGQVSWHIESPDIKYDGHTTEEKYKRIQEYVE